MNQSTISLFFGNKRIATFHSVISFRFYLIERGIPHSFENGEIGLYEADGYWYD